MRSTRAACALLFVLMLSACGGGSGSSATDPGESCGSSTCGAGEFCCNRSCGICAPQGGVCTQQFCD